MNSPEGQRCRRPPPVLSGQPAARSVGPGFPKGLAGSQAGVGARAGDRLVTGKLPPSAQECCLVAMATVPPSNLTQAAGICYLTQNPAEGLISAAPLFPYSCSSRVQRVSPLPEAPRRQGLLPTGQAAAASTCVPGLVCSPQDFRKPLWFLPCQAHAVPEGPWVSAASRSCLLNPELPERKVTPQHGNPDPFCFCFLIPEFRAVRFSSL